MKKILSVVMMGLLMAGVFGCAKTGPTGPEGPQGATGATGPGGPGYASVTINPDRDNTIAPGVGNLSADPSIGFGYSTGTSTAMRALIHFNIAAANLPSDAVLVDAILTVSPNAGVTTGNLLSCHAYPLTKDWTETGSTWTMATSTISWSTVGADYVTTSAIGSFLVDPTTTSAISCSLDPAYVQNWLGGQVNCGVVIKSDTESGLNSNMSVYSRDASDAAKRPTLRLVYGRTSTMGITATSIRAKYQKDVLGLQ